MLYLYDRATVADALARDLEPRLRDLLARRVAALDTPFGDLADWTEFLVVEPGDADEDVGRTLGFDPLVDPDGVAFGEPGFTPCWDYLARRDGWFEMLVTFGGAFAYVLLVADDDRTPPALRELCRRYEGEER